jgi:hypothetical protein
MGCTKTSAPFNFVYVGVQSLQNTFTANIFPNPGNNQLTIFTTANHTDLVFKIIDMNGRICLSQAFKPTANQQTIATNELANGVYQVLLSSETATWSSKWVKIN